MDHENHFMTVNVGWPGSVHDARILSNSEVFHRGEAGTLVPQSVLILAGVPVPVVILGDPAYPLLPWLLKTLPWDWTEHIGKQVQHQTEQSSCCCRVHLWSAEGEVAVTAKAQRCKY